MKNIFLLCTLTAFATRLAAAEAVAVTPDYLNGLAEQMRTNHPALRAANAQVAAATAGVSAVRSWEDPMAVVGGLGARKEMRADEGDIIYGLEQKLPLFGKPERERQIARAELATETAGWDYKFQKLRVELARAAFRTALAARVTEIGEQDVAWLDSLRQSVEGSTQAGRATLTDILQVQTEQAKRATQLQTDRNLLASEQAGLNRLLNRATDAPWPKLELPPVAAAIPYSARLVDFALKYEPKTKVQEQQVQQAAAKVDAARRERYPDLFAGFEGRTYSGDGSFRQGMLTLRLSLPWFNNGKINADIRREQARQSAVENELADERLAIREEVQRLAAKIDAARREALLYRDQLIPRAETTLTAVRAGWQSGQNTFRDVLDTHRLLLESRLMHARAVAEQYETLSELVLCCGLGDLNALQMVAAEPTGSAPATNAPPKN
jgi:outer membrane protein TolC